jgi:allantoinase
MLPSHNRFKYSAIKKRPVFDWPGNKRLAVYIAVNIEHFPYGVQCGVDLDRQTQPWSQRSWLWARVRQPHRRVAPDRLVR